jgi:hypothetical protein
LFQQVLELSPITGLALKDVEAIGELPKLEKLSIERLEIDRLPAWIFKLQRLKVCTVPAQSKEESPTFDLTETQ